MYSDTCSPNFVEHKKGFLLLLVFKIRWSFIKSEKVELEINNFGTVTLITKVPNINTFYPTCRVSDLFCSLGLGKGSRTAHCLTVHLKTK